jgi:anti-sigma B factor antagonist
VILGVPTNGGTGFQLIKESETMKVDVRTIGDVRVLDWSGKITLGEGTIAIRNTTRDILNNGGKKIIMNLAHVNYIDSSGIGELVHTYSTITSSGGQLRLLNLTKKLHDPLQIAKLLTVFPTFDNEQAAVESFK